MKQVSSNLGYYSIIQKTIQKFFDGDFWLESKVLKIIFEDY